jgi:protein phosphatase
MPGVNLEIEAVCDRGCVRENNEDMVLVGTITIRDGSQSLTKDVGSTDVLLCAVADGMGGQNAGEVASQAVIEKFSAAMYSLSASVDEIQLHEELTSIATNIHRDLIRNGLENGALKGMGSTLTGVLFHGGNQYSLHAGDSRLYRFRRGYLMQLTKDHSLREMSNDVNAPKNVIVNSFGGGEKFFIEISKISVQSGDIYLLCSDGLHDMITDDDIESIINQWKGKCSQWLIEEAKRRGGKDNISVVCMSLRE